MGFGDFYDTDRQLIVTIVILCGVLGKYGKAWELSGAEAIILTPFRFLTGLFVFKDAVLLRSTTAEVKQTFQRQKCNIK